MSRKINSSIMTRRTIKSKFILLISFGIICLYYIGIELSYYFYFNENCTCSLITAPLYHLTHELFIKIDPKSKLITKDLLKNHPNFPTKFWEELVPETCSSFPYLTDIKWSGNTWQKFEASDGTNYLLYSAIYDERPSTGAVVRIVSLVEATLLPSTPYCQFWYNSSSAPVPVKVTSKYHFDYQFRSQSRHMPFLISCPIPPLNIIPTAVSLVGYPCETSTNLLKVVVPPNFPIPYSHKTIDTWRTLKKEKKKLSIGVCGPALYYYHEDFSLRLIEWFELMKVIGIDKVHLYDSDVHPNVSKVLNYYVDEGFLDVLPFEYPSPYLNIPSLKRLWTIQERLKMFALENIYFTDCVLRNHFHHDFIAHFDPDEVPILHKYTSLIQLIQDYTQNDYDPIGSSGFDLGWNFFYNDLPLSTNETISKHLFYLRHINRSTTFNKLGKSIYSSYSVVAVSSHQPLLCLTGDCYETERIDKNIGYLGHFTKSCKDHCQQSDIILEDNTLQRYHQTVNQTFVKVVKHLNLIGLE